MHSSAEKGLRDAVAAANAAATEIEAARASVQFIVTTGVVSAVTAVGEVSDDLLTPLHEAVGAVNAAAYEALRVGYAVMMRAGSNGAVLEFDISEMDNSREAESLVNEPKWKRHWHGD